MNLFGTLTHVHLCWTLGKMSTIFHMPVVFNSTVVIVRCILFNFCILHHLCRQMGFFFFVFLFQPIIHMCQTRGPRNCRRWRRWKEVWFARGQCSGKQNQKVKLLYKQRWQQGWQNQPGPSMSESLSKVCDIVWPENARIETNVSRKCE